MRCSSRRWKRAPPTCARWKKSLRSPPRLMKWRRCAPPSSTRGSPYSKRRRPWFPNLPSASRARTPPPFCGSSRPSKSKTTSRRSTPTTTSRTRSSTPSPRPNALRVMGLDPGVVTVIESGVITTASAQPLEARLDAIYGAVRRLIEAQRPSFLVVEDLYAEYKFPRTAILMGHARGVVCLAARQLGVGVTALAPSEVKRAMTGNGSAGKAQVQRGVQSLLGLRDLPRPSHVADALGLAVTGLARVTGITPRARAAQ